MRLCTRRLMEKQSGIWTTVNGATTENIRLGTELLQLPKPWCFGLCHKTIDTTIATHLLLMKQLSWKCVFLLTHWRFFLRPQVSLLPMRKHWQDDDNVVFFFYSRDENIGPVLPLLSYREDWKLWRLSEKVAAETDSVFRKSWVSCIIPSALSQLL